MRWCYLMFGLLGVFSLLVVGCGGGGSSDSSSSSQVKLLVGDAPLHLQDGTTVTAVNVNIARVELLREADNEETKVTLYDAGGEPASLNLLQLANQSLTSLPNLGMTPVPAGVYTQLRVILADNNTVEVDGDLQAHQLTVSSGQQTGFKVPVNITLNAGTLETLLLDFNLAKLNQHGEDFSLTPNALRLVKISQTGTVNGTVSLPTDLQLTNDLRMDFTLMDQFGQPVTDASGNALATQVTIPAATSPVPTSVTFIINGVPAGTYTLHTDVTYGDAPITVPDMSIIVLSGEQTPVTMEIQSL